MSTPVLGQLLVTDQEVSFLISASTLIRGDIEDFVTFKLSAEKKCFLRPLVSAEVSLHALASMIEKLHTQTSFAIHWQSITSSA